MPMIPIQQMCFSLSKIVQVVISFSSIFNMLYWQVHLIISNVHWMVTAGSHITVSTYHIMAYVYRDQPDEPENRKTNFIALLFITHIMFMCLSYFVD